MSAPPAQGVRLHWEDLPARIRAAVEGWLGEPVIEAATQTGGFSPGVAARLRAASGRRVFLKAVGHEPNPDSAPMHRREIRIAAALPATAPAPRLLWSLDEGPGGWVALLYEDIAGRQPRIPWREEELAQFVGRLRLRRRPHQRPWKSSLQMAGRASGQFHPALPTESDHTSRYTEIDTLRAETHHRRSTVCPVEVILSNSHRAHCGRCADRGYRCITPAVPGWRLVGPEQIPSASQHRRLTHAG